MKEQDFGYAMLCNEGWDGCTSSIETIIEGAGLVDKRPSA